MALLRICGFSGSYPQSGSFCGASTLGRPAYSRDDAGLSLVARLSGFIPDDAGIACGLPSPPIGETFTPAPSRTGAANWLLTDLARSA
jgi:hypothetical protein